MAIGSSAATDASAGAAKVPDSTAGATWFSAGASTGAAAIGSSGASTGAFTGGRSVGHRRPGERRPAHRRKDPPSRAPPASSGGIDAVVPLLVTTPHAPIIVHA